jgi:antitoxin component YwqK of YwqJK toxin-antitoxin module
MNSNSKKKEYEGESIDDQKNGIGKEYHENGKLFYEGEFKDDKFHGEGKLYNLNGKLYYEGKFKDNKFHGEGKQYDENYCNLFQEGEFAGILLYEGEYQDSKRNGKGKEYHLNGILKYEGEFKDGKWNGEGKSYNPNGKLYYEGKFIDSKSHGIGKQYYENGKLYYEGQFINDKFHGKGKGYYEGKNGNLMYEGDFIDNNFHGKGKLYDENGKLKYEGEFEDGEKNGKGKAYQKNGILGYEGKYKDDKFHGKGKLYENGNLFHEGNFKDHEIHGKGIRYYEGKYGKQYQGDFIDAKFHGKGKAYHKNGNLFYEGEFEDNKFQGEGKLYNENGILYYEGKFINDEFHGKGKIYYDNGKLIYEGKFKDCEEYMGIYYFYYDKSIIIIDNSKNIFKPTLTIKKNKKIYQINCNYYNKKNSKIYYNKKKIIIKGHILKMEVEIIDFCKKICNLIKFQKIYKRYLLRKKFKNVLKQLLYEEPTIKIQTYVRGYITRNRLYNIRNILCTTFSPFYKIRKLYPNFIKIKTIYKKPQKKKKIIEVSRNNNLNHFILNKKEYKIPSPKRKVKVNNHKNKNRNNKKICENITKQKKKNTKIIHTGKVKKLKKINKNNNNDKYYYKNLKIVDGNRIKRFSNGSFQVINNETGQWILYDKEKKVIKEHDNKCLINTNYIDAFLNNKSSVEENYIYLNCHGLTKEDLKIKILKIIESKNLHRDSIILNVGRGYHTNNNGEKLIIKKFIYELQERFLKNDKNKDPFFCDYPENMNFLIKKVYRNNFNRSQVEQLLCIYLN